jgi:hypothetical protein
VTRRITIAVLLALWAGAASAQTQADPVAYVRAIYRVQVNLPYDKVPAWYSWAFSPRLRALIDADRKEAHGEIGRIEFDPIIDAQDYQLSDVTVSWVSRSADHAVVDALFRNIDREQQIRYDFVRVRGRWLIDEMREMKGQRWTLSKILAGAPDAFPQD